MSIDVRAVDDRGRIVLGKPYANRLVQIEQVSETEFRIVFVKVIPEREVWLFANPEARDSLQRGLEQARQNQFVDGPNLDADLAIFDEGF